MKSQGSRQYNDLNDFLAKHSAKENKTSSNSWTNTRIPDKILGIYGGTFIIPKEEHAVFWQYYYEAVFVNKKMEYLTEKQIKENGPILIDLDFRYNYAVEERQHGKENIIDILGLYLDVLKDIFVFEENKTFPIFVFEKPHVNRLADGTLTKDGIHIIIGIKMCHELQILLRKKVLEKIEEVCDLPLINDWNSVLDEGISKGTTNWQIYGSRKPGNQAYNMVYHFNCNIDLADGEFMMKEMDAAEFDLSKNLYKLSAQYEDNESFEINLKITEEYENLKKMNKPKKSYNSKIKLKLLLEEEDGPHFISIEDITNVELLKQAVDNMLKGFSLNDYNFKEMHEYTQVLPEKYYQPGSHDLNRKVAFALKNTDERLFLSWIMLRSKASDFDYGRIPSLYKEWKQFKDIENGLTKRSILYWAKQDALEDYLKVKKNSINHFLEETLTHPTDYDFAMVLNQMYKDVFICSDIDAKKWFVFKNHHWERDFGHQIRLAISREMYGLYQDKQLQYMFEMLQDTTNDERTDAYKKKIKNIGEIMPKLKKTNDKNNILKEAANIFYDEDFNKKMDENRYLLCFKNGVVDLKNKIFRDGYPQDYITKTTGIPYIVNYKESRKYAEIEKNITLFMNQLFPDASLNVYMWEHLASVLIGENINQTFNIYRGNGSNGKSLLTDLMNLALGEYSGMVPITLVTEKRVSVGSTSSEVMQLKGVRYAVMQEPSKDARINEGIMKQLTGDSTMQARALYSESEKFAIQFHLVVCTNTLFEICSNDDGTWRRIRIVEFKSKFVNPEVQITDEKYQFRKDPILKEKLVTWAPVFVSMLVNKVFETQGIVNSCDIVMSESNKYRQNQDHISAFVSEMVSEVEGKTISKEELSQEFKKWFEDSQGNRKKPKGMELFEYMDNKFGTCKSKVWKNIQINYPKLEDDLQYI